MTKKKLKKDELTLAKAKKIIKEKEKSIEDLLKIITALNNEVRELRASEKSKENALDAQQQYSDEINQKMLMMRIELKIYRDILMKKDILPTEKELSEYNEDGLYDNRIC